VNKIRALCAWYTKGIEGGGDLRTRVNQAISLDDLISDIWSLFGYSLAEHAIAQKYSAFLDTSPTSRKNRPAPG
jgi:hypothetical protein